MRAHNWLEDVFGSRVKIKMVRELLKHSKFFTMRELAKDINVSHTGVRKALRDLQGANLIKVEYHGGSNLISVNFDSVVYSSLLEAFENES